MTPERKQELFDNMLEYIWTHNEAEGKEVYVHTLQHLGFTQEEIQEELENCDFDDEEEY